MNKNLLDFLERNNLEEYELNIQISTEASTSIVDSINTSFYDDFPIVSVTFSISDAEPIEVGQAIFKLIDCECFRDTYIRDVADGIEFSFYQSVASVKIFPDEFAFYDDEDLDSTENAEYLRGMSAKSAFISENTPYGYPSGYELFTFEKNSYSPNSLGVYGKLLVLQGIRFLPDYNKRFLTSYFIKHMISYFKQLNWFNHMIVNPNISEDYLKRSNYPAKNKNSYIKLWEANGFLRSTGKLHNNDFCLVRELSRYE